MNKLRHILQSVAVLTFVLLFPAAAHAQATRTWVSGIGDDANPCSRTAPCKTFAGAIVKTAVNGEINALDSGSFSTVTITKSITIDGTGQQAAILASGGTAVNINISTSVANDPLATVRLKNLSLNGTGTCGSGCHGRQGVRGIHVSSASQREVKLFVENAFIHGFLNEGILFNGPGGDLSVKNCSIVDNGGSGIRTLSSDEAASKIIHVTIDKTHTDLNQQGVRFEGNSFGVVKDSTASNNTLNGYVVFPSSGQLGNAEMTVMDSVANNNKQFGVFAGGTGGLIGTVRIVNMTAIHNTVSQLEISAGGTVCTNQKNHIGAPSDVPSPCFLDQ